MDITYRTDSSFDPFFNRSCGTYTSKVDNAYLNDYLVCLRLRLDVAQKPGIVQRVGLGHAHAVLSQY